MASAEGFSGAAAGGDINGEVLDVKPVPPVDDEEAKETAIRDMPAPKGYRRCAVPPKSNSRSSVYEHGVRFEEDCSKPDGSKMKWSCACSPNCRASAMKGIGTINHTKNNTGNVTRHLSGVHGKVSLRTKKTKKKQEDHNTAGSALQASILNNPDPGRLMCLLFVKAFIIGHLLPFSLPESDDVRLFFEVCSHAMFPQTKLYSKMVKHYLIETYSAMIMSFSHRLKTAIAGAGGPVLHANFDLWTSKTSNDKCIGLRLFWCTPEFVLDSALVAVKLFQPAAELSESIQLSGALLLWVEEVLKEFGLSTKNLFCTVTDAGSDVKRPCLKILASQWEWCFPHMLNCALVEAFGTNASKAACKNTEARKIIDAVKKVVEHLNKSNVMKVKYEDMQHLIYGNATKLVNAAPHRWIPTCNVLEEVLRSWDALEKHYADNEVGGIFPLAVHKTAIEELYSIMQPVALLIKNSQRSDGPAGLSTYIDMCSLHASVLDLDKPLLVTVPRKVRLGEAGPTRTETKRAAASLQEVTKTTRMMLRQAILKRFFDKRYDELVVSSPEPAYLFEMAACMSPYFQRLKWLPKLCSSEAEAGCVRKCVKNKVVDVMVSMAEAVGAEDSKQPGTGGTTSSNKRKRPLGVSGGSAVSKKNDEAMTKRMADSGLFSDDSGDDDRDDYRTHELSLRDVCQQEFDRFRERFKDAKLRDYPLGELLSFWAGEGRSLYPNMARVARVLLSVPASAAVLERDFSTAGRLITGSHSRLDGEYVEITLFLNGNKEYIPAKIPSLSERQAQEAVPRRLTNPTAEVVALSTGVKNDNATDEYVAEIAFCEV